MIDRLEKSGGSVGCGRSHHRLVPTDSPSCSTRYMKNGCDYDHVYIYSFSGPWSIPFSAEVCMTLSLPRQEGSRGFHWYLPPVAVGARGRNSLVEKRATQW